jgi:hypothetical protein
MTGGSQRQMEGNDRPLWEAARRGLLGQPGHELAHAVHQLLEAVGVSDEQDADDQNRDADLRHGLTLARRLLERLLQVLPVLRR